MTSLDIGQAQGLIERAKKIKLPPGPTEQDFTDAFSMPDSDASDPRDNTARVRTILGDDDFQQGRTIDAMRALGVTYEDLPSEQQQTWDRYSKAWVRAAADMVRAESISKQPGFSSSGGRAVERFVDPLVQIPLDTAYLGAAASSALSEVTGWTEGGNSHMALPRTMNAMLGLEQTQTPIARHYLGALEMAARTGTPVADVYRSTLMADEIVRGSREPGMNIPEDAAGIVGYIYGLTKKGILGGVVGNIAPKAEKLLGLEKLHVKALEWAAKGGMAQRVAGRAAAEMVTPGLRFGVAAAGEAGTGTGDRQELSQAAKAGVVSATMFPVFTAIGHGAAKLAAKVTGEGLVLRNAFTKWIDAMPVAQSRAFADGGAKAVDDMFARFIREGMPGVSVSLKQRVAGAGIQSVLEGIGFSAMSLPFYHDIGKAIASGKWADVEPVLEEIAASSLAMFMMRSGGLFYQAPGTVGPAILRKIQKDPWLRPEYAKEAEPTPDVYTQRKSDVEFVDPAKVEAEKPAEVAKPVEKPVDPTEPIAEGKVEAKPAEAAKEVAPEAPAKPKPVDKDPPQSARSLLESKLALHGKGELVDIERGVYVIKESDGSGRQVRFRDGQYQSRPLLSEGEWKKDKALQKTLGRKQPIDLTPKIPEQFTLVDPLMARVATDPSLGLTPAQQDTVRAAASVASRVPAEADRGVLAGLQMIREKPVAEWSADQVGHWVQTVLNGKAPDVLRTSGMAWVNNAPTAKIAPPIAPGHPPITEAKVVRPAEPSKEKPAPAKRKGSKAKRFEMERNTEYPPETVEILDEGVKLGKVPANWRETTGPKGWKKLPKTGQPIRTTGFHGSGRVDKASVYGEGADGPALGKGRYTATNPQHAKKYGEVSEVTVELDNPLVLTSDKQLAELAGERGVPYSNAERNAFLAKVRQKIDQLGHDGVVVDIPRNGDMDANGNSVKRLREIFGESQIVEFAPPAPTPLASPVAAAPTTAPAKKARAGLPIVRIHELARAEGIETKGKKRAEIVAALEAKGIETREPVAEVKESTPQFDREPEGVLRLIAQSAGIDVSKVEAKDLAKTLREAGVAEGNEAGAFNLRIAGATTAASIATWSLLNSGVPVEAVMGLALAGIAYPVYKGFGKQLYKTLQDFGPSGLAQRVTDLALESLRAAPPIAARLNRLVQPYLYLTSEQPLAVQRMGMEAALPNLVAAATAATLGWGMGSHPLMIIGGYFAGGAAGALGAAAITKARNPRAQIRTRLRSLATKRTQEEEWVKDANGDEFFVTRFRLFADGWRALDDTVTKGERRIYDRYRDILREEQFIADEVGMQMLGADGKRRSTILPEGTRRLLMRLSDDGRAIFEHPDSPEALAYARILSTLNDVSFEVAKRELAGVLAAERSIGIEQARKIKRWPTGFRLNGKVHRVLDDRPFESGLALLTHHVPRLATFSVVGPEKTAGYTSLSPEQLQARKDIEAYTGSSPQAHERWIEVSRALHNLRIDKHYLRPGSIPHTLYTRVLSPMRSLWLSQALSGAVTAAKNVLEPLLGTVPIYTSHPIAAQAMLRGWYMRLLAPAEWKAEVTALRNEGYLLPGTPRRFGDLIPGSGGGGKLSASDPNWYRLVEKQMDFVAAGNAGANKMGDVVVALAGKIKVDAWKGQVERTSAQRANDLETLRMMDFKPEVAQRMVDGHGTQKDYVDYVSSLRSYTMGQRPRAERGRWEQLALVEQLVPFRSWVSGNIRVWGDHFAQMKRGLNLDQSLPREEARAARRQFFKLVASKGAAGMMGLVATYYLAYGSSIVEAFKDENDDMDAGKFMGEWAKYVAFQEVSGPIISTMMQAGKTGNADPDDLLLGIANQIPYFDMARDLTQAVTMTGPYLNQATPTAGAMAPLTAIRSFADRVAIFLEGQMGVMRNIRAITDDPQMKLAIRKYYEVLPIEGGAPSVGFTEFRSRMRRMRTKLRSSIAHPETWNPEQRDRLLKEAMGFHKDGWDGVMDSLRNQKLVPADAEKRKALQEGMSKTLFERLVELDSRLDWLIGYAQRRKG